MSGSEHTGLPEEVAGAVVFLASPLASYVNGAVLEATGVRILATMLRELDRRQARYALETLCIGGGQGLSAVFERVP